MIIVAGAGPGHPRLLTQEVREKIISTPRVLSFGRISESLYKIRKDIEPVGKVSELLRYLDGEDTLILASGDPLFYGVVAFLKRQNVPIDEVYPGISSFQYLMAKLQRPWQEAQLFSVHGREVDFDELAPKGVAVFLTDVEHNPSWLNGEFHRRGATGRLYVGTRLSYDDEEIRSYRIGEEMDDVDPLTVVVIDYDMVK